jgi:integrase
MTKSKLIYSKKYDHVFKYQTKDGFKWGYRYPYYDDNNIRHESSRRGYTTAKDAYAALLDVQGKVTTNQTEIVSNANMTMGKWAEMWFESKQYDWAPSTKAGNRRILNSKIIPWLGKCKLSDLNKMTYQNLYLNKLKKFSPNTQRTLHRLVMTIINSAVENEVIPANKIHNISFGKSPEKVIMSAEQLARFNVGMRKYARPDTRMLFSLLEYTGCRKGEVLAITWNDVDFKNNTIHITKTRDEYGTRPPKTPSSIRYITFDSTLRKELLSYRQVQWQRFAKRKEQFTLDAYVLMAKNGIPFKRNFTSRLQHLLKTIGMDEELKGFTCHSFRHTHATLLIDSGVPIQTVSKRLGHSKVTTTYEFYAHDLPGRQEMAAKKFDELMSKFG